MAVFVPSDLPKNHKNHKKPGTIKPRTIAKNHKKPGDSVKNLENLASHFFRRDKFKEHFK